MRVAGETPVTSGAAGTSSLLLDGFGLLDWNAHAVGNALGDVSAAHQQDSHEAWHPALGHDDVRDARSDIDECLGAAGESEPVDISEHAKHREGVQVDARRREPGRFDRGDE